MKTYNNAPLPFTDLKFIPIGVENMGFLFNQLQNFQSYIPHAYKYRKIIDIVSFCNKHPTPGPRPCKHHQ